MDNTLNKNRNSLIKKLAGSWKGSAWEKIDASKWQREIRKYPVRQYSGLEIDGFIKLDKEESKKT